MAARNADLAQRTEEQSVSLEEIAATMEQLTQTVRRNANHAHQASHMLALNAAMMAGWKLREARASAAPALSAGSQVRGKPGFTGGQASRADQNGISSSRSATPPSGSRVVGLAPPPPVDGGREDPVLRAAGRLSSS